MNIREDILDDYQKYGMNTYTNPHVIELLYNDYRDLQHELDAIVGPDAKTAHLTPEASIGRQPETYVIYEGRRFRFILKKDEKKL